jgi:hypothetical protein
LFQLNWRGQEACVQKKKKGTQGSVRLGLFGKTGVLSV